MYILKISKHRWTTTTTSKSRTLAKIAALVELKYVLQQKHNNKFFLYVLYAFYLYAFYFGSEYLLVSPSRIYCTSWTFILPSMSIVRGIESGNEKEVRQLQLFSDKIDNG